MELRLESIYLMSRLMHLVLPPRLSLSDHLDIGSLLMTICETQVVVVVHYHRCATMSDLPSLSSSIQQQPVHVLDFIRVESDERFSLSQKYRRYSKIKQVREVYCPPSRLETPSHSAVQPERS